LSTEPRQVTDRGLPPALVFDGEMTAALEAPFEQWKEYPYSRTADRQSFSQLLFALLDMPEAFGEEGEFVTFNQFLRAHYADQDSPNTTVLKYEDQFDKPATREAIGHFLLGGTDQNLTTKEKALREAEKNLANAMASVAAGNILLGSDYNELNADSIRARQRTVEAEISDTEQAIKEKQSDALVPLSAVDVESAGISVLTKSLVEAREQLNRLTSEYGETEFELTDSKIFIQTLQDRVSYLRHSIHSAENFGTLFIEICPVCGTDVEPALDEQSCYLCKSDDPELQPMQRYISLLNSAQSQIEQSKRVQTSRRR